ncbi:response regulator transcription factor [Rheinheimera riviphila]|uniref:Response regulator transcription factor n=1 Tax=Rheinheimera riviphila TaxID=1834037 RepID=A0A437R1I0_9GAMM|nr:response regulator transcription factor [Rheinheimera riviphila]RVU40590.1 response regulator transcription factor [Rheinheimera riviphila]
MIRIAVIDDQTLVRQGIVSLLSLAADLTVVAQAANGAGIVELIQQHQVDVVLMDIQMPQVSGIDALHLLNQAQSKVPVIILTTFDDNDRVLQAMQAGARGYLLKDVALELLVDAIHTVHRGGSLLQPAITDKILASFLQRKTDEPSAEDQHAEALSGKELEILRLLATGFSNREIAAAVFKSEGTVKNQVSAILAKLGVRDRTKAVLKAIDLGLLG